MTCFIWRQRKSFGQSASEYGLVIGIVSLGLLGALTFTGNSISSAFDAIANGSGTAGGITGGAGLNAPGTLLKPPYDEGYSGDLGNAGVFAPAYDTDSPKTPLMTVYGEPTICGSESGATPTERCMKLMGQWYTLDEIDAIETAGGMGSELMNALLSLLDKIKQDLIAKGEDPQLIDLIGQLANEGHDLADIQAVMEGVNERTVNGALSLPHQQERNEFDAVWQAVQVYLQANPDIKNQYGSVISDASGKIKEIGVNYQIAVEDYEQKEAAGGGEVPTLDLGDSYLDTRSNANTICQTSVTPPAACSG